MQSSKKPPMDLDEEGEVVQETQEGPKPGGLSYNRRPNRVITRGEGGSRREGPGFSLTTAVVGAFIGFIFSLGLIFFITPSKADVQYLNNQLLAAKDALSKDESIISQQSSKIDNVVGALGDYAKRNELLNYATKTDVSNINLNGYALKSDLPVTSGFATKTDVTSQIKALQDQIDKLEATPTPVSDGTVSSLVKAEISTIGNMPLAYTIPANDTSVHSVTFRLKITNGLAKNIENVQLFLQLYGYATSGGSFPNASTTINLPTLTSNGVAWVLYSNTGNSFNFTNVSGWTGTGLSLASGASKTYYMSFNFRPAIPPTVDTMVQFSPDLLVDSYDIVQ